MNKENVNNMLSEFKQSNGVYLHIKNRERNPPPCSSSRPPVTPTSRTWRDCLPECLGKDGGGVNGSYTDLLPGLIWNYIAIVEKPLGTNNGAIAREKHITSDIQIQLWHNQSGKECGGDLRGLSGWQLW